MRNIGNIFNKSLGKSYNGISSTGKMEEKPKTKDEQKLDYAIGIIGDRLEKIIERSVPMENKFLPVGDAFIIPGTDNKVAEFTIRQDEEKPKNIRRLWIGVRREDSDVVFEQDIYTGTKKEIITHIRDFQKEETKTFIADKIAELSRQLDDSVPPSNNWLR